MKSPLLVARRRLQAVHVAMTLLQLALLVLVCWAGRNRLGDALVRLPGLIVLMLAIAAPIAFVSRFAHGGIINAGRRRMLTMVLHLNDDADDRPPSNDIVREIWGLYVQRTSAGPSSIGGMVFVLCAFYMLQPSLWTAVIVLLLTAGHAAYFPTRRKAFHFVASELAWLESQREKSAASGKLPAGIPWQPNTVWDPVCGLPVLRIVAGLIAIVVISVIWPHLTTKWDNLLPAIMLLPFLYALAIVAVLGRNWKKGAPRWMRTGW